MNLVELLEKSQQLQEQINAGGDINTEELSKQLESIMNKVYEIIDDDSKWVEVTPSELEELNNSEIEENEK